jgi:WD40 repeat protein
MPGESDGVLGNTAASPPGAIVLGGLEGVRQRLNHPIVAHRVAALQEAEKYGRPGLDLIIQALQDGSVQVQKAAYFLLQGRREKRIRRSLAAYDSYSLFESLATLEGHQQGVTAVAIAADSRTIVSSGRDGVLKIWDWWAREAVFTIEANLTVFTITIHPDAQIFTIRDKYQTIKAWSLRNGQEIDPEEQDTRGIASVMRSQDNHLILGSQNQIKVWSLKTGREICHLQGHSSLVTAVAVSSDRQLIVSGSEDKTVRVWGIA